MPRRGGGRTASDGQAIFLGRLQEAEWTLRSYMAPGVEGNAGELGFRMADTISAWISVLYARVRQIGFLTPDRQVGTFALAIRSIQVK